MLYRITICLVRSELRPVLYTQAPLLWCLRQQIAGLCENGLYSFISGIFIVLDNRKNSFFFCRTPLYIKFFIGFISEMRPDIYIHCLFFAKMRGEIFYCSSPPRQFYWQICTEKNHSQRRNLLLESELGTNFFANGSYKTYKNIINFKRRPRSSSISNIALENSPMKENIMKIELPSRWHWSKTDLASHPIRGRNDYKRF